MLFFTIVLVVSIGYTRASQSLQPTLYTNRTRISPSGALTTGCPANCYRDQLAVGHISWSQMSIATTIVAETHILVVNNRTNITRTSTIHNTGFDRRLYAAPETNSAGTAIATVFRNTGNSTTYQTIAYPTTAYNDYDPTYSLCGTLPTTTSGSATCLAYQDCAFTEKGFYPSLNGKAPSFAFPSHPPLPQGIQPGLNTIQDPKGLTYQGVVSDECDDSDVIKPLFPNLGLWSCKPLNECVQKSNLTNSTMGGGVNHAGMIALHAAVYLTATSTSMEAGGSIPDSTPAPFLVPPPVDSPTNSITGPTIPSAPVPGAPIPALHDSEGLPTPAPSVSEGNIANPSPATSIVLDEAASQPGALPPSSITVIPIAVASTDAHGNVGMVTSLATAIPVLVTSIDAKGSSVVSSSLSIIPAIASPAPAALVPFTISSVNAQGSVAVSTSFAAAIPVVTTFTNAHGSIVISTSVSIAPVTASIPNIILSTNAQGAFVSSKSYLPAVVLTSTNSEGSRVVTTSQLLEAASATASPSVVSASPALTIGSQTIVANSLNQYRIGSQTLTQGGVITVSGTRISLSPKGTEAVVGTSTQQLTSQLIPTITYPPLLTVGTQTISPNAQGQYKLGSQTLTPGGVVTFSGTQISLASNGAYAVAGTSTENLAVTSSPELTLGSQLLTANALGQYIIGSQALTPGGQITVSGTRISLASNGAYAVVGSSTETLALPTPPVLTLGSQTITANALGQYIIGTQTLTPGGDITLSGTRISLASNDAYAVVGASTENLALATITSPPALTLGSQTITPDAQGQYIIGSQTLTPGGVVTVSGTRVSLAPNGADAVIGTSTEWLNGNASGGSGGGNGMSMTGTGSRISSGGAQSRQKGLWVEGLLVFMGMWIVIWL